MKPFLSEIKNGIGMTNKIRNKNDYCQNCKLLKHQCSCTSGYWSGDIKEAKTYLKKEVKEIKMNSDKIILDACCGKRMMWFNKDHPLVEYHDQRVEISPTAVGDFRKLDFSDKSFKLVVIDPPHDIFHRKKSGSGFEDNFGRFDPDTWKDDLKQGLSECWRVLDDYGVLIFKWNTHDAKINKILPLLPAEPLFMNKIQKVNSHMSETIWFCFMKLTPPQR